MHDRRPERRAPRTSTFAGTRRPSASSRSGRRGVDLACDLLVAGLDTPATVEVAGLRRDATLGDSEELLRSMLEEHGVQIPVPQTDADKFAALRLVFGFLNLPVSEFEGPFYERLPEWGE
jgi:hypothetical protein